MPRGVYKRAKGLSCRTCGFKSKSKSIFMTHIRSKHAELYKNSARKSKKELIKIKLEEPIINTSNGTRELSALELLDKLKHQRNFIVDVVNLIEGMLRQIN